MKEASSPRRFRFSLRQLGVLVVFLGMAIALAMQYRELTSLRIEVRRLRDEAGHLTIDDPKKLAAIEIRHYTELTWSWKVHIPQEGRFVLYSKLNGLPSDIAANVTDVPTKIDGSMNYEDGGYAIALPPGKTTVITSLRPQSNGEIEFHISAGKRAFDGTFPVDRRSWPHVRDSSTSIGVRPESHEQSPDKPLVLLSLRADGNTPPAKGISSGDSTDGFRVWIEQFAE